MTGTVVEQLRHLGDTLGVLQARVRAAVAGEVGRAVAEAAAEVVAAALGGRLPAPGRARRQDPYDDGDGWDDDDPDRRWHPGRPAGPADEHSMQPAAAAALAAALAAGRWWLARAGTPWGAAGLGLAVAGAVLVGGPATRAAAAVAWAAHRLIAATDALGDGATALDRI
jgi:hypothetical protein